MKLKEHLEVLAKREKSKIGNVLAAYEVKDWPDGRLDELSEMGVLDPVADATMIKCPGCSEGCPVEPVPEVANDGSMSYSVLCGTEGSFDVDPFERKQWQISKKIHDVVPKKKKRNRTRSSKLTNRQTQVYQLVHVQGKAPSDAAYEMQCSVQNVSKLLKVAEEKLRLGRSRSISNSRMQKLPEDNRGQTSVSDGEK